MAQASWPHQSRPRQKRGGFPMSLDSDRQLMARYEKLLMQHAPTGVQRLRGLAWLDQLKAILKISSSNKLA